ncbi:MAG: hypothetical protein IJV69_00755, partial [Kiritimatiellae bacterium]|nr:hypothetical protein [Kiritimatiellia bacterium]
TLLKDALNATLISNGKAINDSGKSDVTLDLNGHSFSLSGAGTGNQAEFTLTVTDSSETKSGKVGSDIANLLIRWG